MDKKSTEEVPTFQFKNEGLSHRCNDVFGCLDALEQKHKAFEKTRSEEDAESDKSLIHGGPSAEDSECLTKDTFKHPGHDYHSGRRGVSRSHKERSRSHGEFKIPNSRPFRGRGGYRGRYGRGRSVPDYKIHPDKWTEYSLEDVDVSNSSMKQAAFSFLDEQRKRRENTQREDSVNIESVACSKGLISFKKPVRNSKSEKQTEKKGSSHSNQNIIMDDEDESNDMNEREEMITDSNVEMKEVVEAERNFKDNSSGKRKSEKLDDGENIEEMEGDAGDVEKTGFKSRKKCRKNIRSRQEKNDSDSD